MSKAVCAAANRRLLSALALSSLRGMGLMKVMRRPAAFISEGEQLCCEGNALGMPGGMERSDGYEPAGACPQEAAR